MNKNLAMALFLSASTMLCSGCTVTNGLNPPRYKKYPNCPKTDKTYEGSHKKPQPKNG